MPKLCHGITVYLSYIIKSMGLVIPHVPLAKFFTGTKTSRQSIHIVPTKSSSIQPRAEICHEHFLMQLQLFKFKGQILIGKCTILSTPQQGLHSPYGTTFSPKCYISNFWSFFIYVKQQQILEPTRKSEELSRVCVPGAYVKPLTVRSFCANVIDICPLDKNPQVFIETSI